MFEYGFVKDGNYNFAYEHPVAQFGEKSFKK